MADDDSVQPKSVFNNVRDQVIDANHRLITGTDTQGRDLPDYKSDEFVRDTGNLLQKKLMEKYPGVENSDPNYYSR